MKPSRKEIQAWEDFLIHNDISRFAREIGKTRLGGALRGLRIAAYYIKDKRYDQS